MAKRKPLDPADYIQPLIMNGLHGRVLHLPARTSKKREILLIYGQHANIERMFSMAEELNKYGSVTLPDLPGFGGMESFYKIGEKPDIDTMADYMAAFVKMRYSRKRVAIIGFSYGFLVATRMLQRYPELTRKVDLLVSIVGFVHHDDFKFTKRSYNMFKYSTAFFALRFPAWITKTFLLRGPLIKACYLLVADKHAKLKDATRTEQLKRIKFEIKLWQCNDIRTYMYSINGMLKIDLCDKTVKLPVYHVAVDSDQYFDNYRVEQHMNVIFTEFNKLDIKLNAHMPTIVASAKEVAPFIPGKLRRLLSKTA